jgi:hypothetical protein
MSIVFDWEFLLGAIVEVTMGALIQAGHVKLGPG